MAVAAFSLFEIFPVAAPELAEGVRLGQGWHLQGEPIWSARPEASLLFDAEAFAKPEPCFLRLQVYDPRHQLHKSLRLVIPGQPDLELEIPPDGIVSFWMTSPTPAAKAAPTDRLPAATKPSPDPAPDAARRPAAAEALARVPRASFGRGFLGAVPRARLGASSAAPPNPPPKAAPNAPPGAPPAAFSAAAPGASPQAPAAASAATASGSAAMARPAASPAASPAAAPREPARGGLGAGRGAAPLEVRLCLPLLQSPAVVEGTEDERLLGLRILDFIRLSPEKFPIEFSEAEACRAYLLSGWSVPEPSGLWSDGPKAVIRLPRQMWSQAQALRLEFSTLGRPGNVPALGITAEVAGQVLAKWSAGQPRTWPIPLNGCWKLGEDLLLDLIFENPMAPRDLGINQDPRNLGIFLTKLDRQL